MNVPCILAAGDRQQTQDNESKGLLWWEINAMERKMRQRQQNGESKLKRFIEDSHGKIGHWSEACGECQGGFSLV